MSYEVLNSFQKELWLAHMARPEGHPGIFSGGCFLLRGTMDPHIARIALRHLVGHLPLLSATLRMGQEGIPHFELGAHMEPHFAVHDVVEAPDPLIAAIAIRDTFTEAPFTPLGGPLTQFALVRISETDLYFMFKTFHVVASGLANASHFSLFAQIYADVYAQKPIDLGPSPCWSEAVADDKAYLASTRAAQDAAFWQDACRHAPTQRVFPPLPGCPDSLGNSEFCIHSLTPRCMEHLRHLEQTCNTSTATLLIATHALALRLLLGNPVPVAFMVENGERKDPRLMQGFMVNLIPFTPDIQPHTHFMGAIRAVAAQMNALRRHARHSVPIALRTAGMLRDCGHLFDTNINYIGILPEGNSHFTQQDFITLCSRKEEILLGIYAIRGRTKDAPLRMAVHYSRHHFTPEGVARHVARMEAVLAMAAADSQCLIKDFPTLLEEETRTLHLWENGGMAATPPLSIPGLFHRVALHHPDHVAVHGEDGISRTYADVCRHAGALARQLTEAGVGRGHVVAVLARRHPALPECILGIMALGAIYLPVDPDYPAHRIHHMLEDAEAHCLLALESADAIALDPSEATLPPLLVWQPPETFPILGVPFPHDWLPRPPLPNDAAYLIYTSGSTGTPKGVLVSHGGFVNMILAQIQALAITPADHVLHFASPSFDASLSEIFMPLMAGAALYPVSRQRIDTPWDLRAYMEQHAISVVTFPPSYLALYRGAPFAGLRVLLTAGEPPVAEDARRYAQQLAYFNAYGPTEASVCASLQRISPHDDFCAIIGRPLPNTRAYILDAEGRRVPIGAIGELWLAGAGLALGYHKRPDLTAQRFCEPADLPDQKCYRTGDHAVWTEDGRLALLGRVDDQVKIRGHRVEPGEIGTALETHPQVAQAMVVPATNGSTVSLVAFVVPKVSASPPSSAELRDWLGTSLPSYMQPGAYFFLDSFPLAPTGKIDKAALQDIARTDTDNTLSPNSRDNAMAPPLSPNEARLATYYSAVLGHPLASEQDFFLNGGDSLKAVELLNRLENDLGLRLSMRDFMTDSSLSGVARRWREGGDTPARQLDSVSGIDDASILPFTQGQMALWADEQVRGPSPRYHMPLVVELTGNTEDAVRWAEAVRSALSMQPLCTAKVVGPIEAPEFLLFSMHIPPLDILDVAAGPELDAMLDTHIHTPFSLHDAPPVRIALLRTGKNHHIFVLVLHHLVADAIGIQAILGEAATLLAGRAVRSLPRAALLRTAIEEERVFLASAQRAAEEDHWQRHLLPLAPSLLPSLLSYPASKTLPDAAPPLSGTGVYITALFTPEAAHTLRQRARDHGATLLNAMLGLLGDFLCRRAGSEHCLVSVPVGTRQGAALAHVCGYFVNTVPVRLTPHLTPAAAMTAGAAALRHAASHSQLPARLLAESVAPVATSAVGARAVLTEIFATHMELALPTLPSGCGLVAIPRLPRLRAAKAALTFVLLSQGQELRLALEYDTALLQGEKAHLLMAHWTQHMTEALNLPPNALTLEVNLAASGTHSEIHSGGSPAQLCTASTSPPSTTALAALGPRDAAHLLREAWRAVLGVEAEPTSQFFLSGGDSIRAIQLAGYLRQAGFVGFSPSLCFAHPVFANLCAALERQSPQCNQISTVTALHEGDTAPLPPLHAQWVARHPEHWQQFHMALPLRLHAAVDIAQLKEGFFALGQRHEALRLRFDTRQLTCAPPVPPLWLEQDIETHHNEEVLFANAARTLFSVLCTARTQDNGPLYAAVLLRCGAQRHLLLAAHHFALDALSLDIVRRELQSFAATGAWPSPTPNYGAGGWALALSQRSVFADAEDTAREIALWRAQCAAVPASPPADTGCLAQRITLRRNAPVFAHDATRRGAGLPELLATLSAAMQTAGHAPLLLILETHGREELLPGVDISHAVGWFTAAFPLAVLPLASGRSLIDATATYASTLHSLPLRGARFAFAAAAAPDLAERRPHASLNYLGKTLQASSDGTQDALLALPHLATPAALPGMIAPTFLPQSPLDILAYDIDGGLELTATFAPHVLPEEEVSRLLDAWVKALDELARAHKAEATLCAKLARAALCAPQDIAALDAPDPEQQAMLYQMVMDVEAGQPAAHYMQQITMRLRAADPAHINPDALERAWLEVLARHEGLRMLFPRTAHGEFHRLTLASPRSGMERMDLAHLPPDQQLARRDARLRQQRETPFDLTQGPLLLLTLFRRSDADGLYWEMSWCFPHVLMDGWCIGIMLREILSLHEAFARGVTATIPPAPSLRAVQTALGQPDQGELRAWWQEHLAGHIPSGGIAALLAQRYPLMPSTAPFTSSTPEYAERQLHLDTTTSSALARAAARMAVSMPQLVQAVWAVLLGAGHERDIVFGLVHAGRDARVSGAQEAVGLFIRTLPVRVCWKAEASFAELATHVRDNALARAPRERDMLADILPCHGAGAQLFDHLLVFENYPLHGIPREESGAHGEAHTLWIDGLEGHERQPYPLAVSILPGESWQFRLSCHTPRLPLAHLDALVQDLQRLFAALASHVETTEEVHSLSCAALAALLHDISDTAHTTGTGDAPCLPPAKFNDTARPYERHTGIHEIFMQTARRHPTLAACVDSDGDVWSYGELAVAATRVAHGLDGIQSGEPVAIAMPRCARSVAAILGVLLAGGCCMPLDERSPAERTGGMFAAADCCRVIIESSSQGAPLPPKDMLEKPLQIIEFNSLMTCTALPLRHKAPGGAAPAFIMFTSGTTGRPKGVLVPHRAVMRLVRNSDFWQAGQGDAVGQTSPLNFDASILEIWGALLNEAMTVFLNEDTLLSPTRLRQRLEEADVTILWLTAGLFSTLAAEEPEVFRPLRRLYSGGDSMNVGHATKVLAACPDLILYNGYGPTENTTFTAVHRVTQADVGKGARSMPLGRPIANTRVYICADDGSPAPVGQWGELCAAGDGLALGYCGNATATAQAFYILPFANERVYRTGDLARWRPDGLLEFAGRRDTQIKLRGFRIETQEVETALLHLTDVADAAVTVINNGNEAADKMLIAFVTCAARAEMTSEKAQLAILRTILPEYMLPTRIFVCAVLPVDANGKRDRKALKTLAQARMRSWKRDRQTGHSTAPQGTPVQTSLVEEEGQNTTPPEMVTPLTRAQTEREVAALFNAVLDVPIDGPDADFFHLGGQSLKAMRLLARLNERFGVSLPLSRLLRLRTVGAVAACIDELCPPPAVCILAQEAATSDMHKATDWPLSPSQEQFWFQQRLQPDSAVYSMFSMFRVEGSLNIEALGRAVLMLEERHEALRLRLPATTAGTTPRQRIAAPGALRLQVHDCSTHPHPRAEVRRRISAEQARPFRLGEHEPLARACCFVESADCVVVMLAVHHCLCDGWAMELLFADMEMAYNMALRGENAVWPAPSPSYMSHVRERTRRLADPKGQTMLARVIQRLAHAPEPLALPADHPRPAVRSFKGQTLVHRFSPQLTADLRHRATAQGTTIFPVLLAVMSIFFQRHTGARDMVLGVPSACRHLEEEQNVVGLLMNVLPLRLAVEEGDDFNACVRRCSARLCEALDDDAVPLEEVLRHMHVPRQAGRNTLFDILVAYEEQQWTERFSFAGLRMTPYPFAGCQSRLDMSFFFRDKAQGLELHWEYSTDLFTPKTVRRMAARLEMLVKSCCTSKTGQAVSGLSLLPAAEQRLLQSFNQTTEHWKLGGGMHAHFAAQAARSPAAPALHLASGDTITYAQFDAMTARLACWLGEQGFTAGQAAGVCYPRGVEMMVVIFAVLRAGGHYVPLAPDMPEQRLNSMIQDMPTGILLMTAPEAAPRVTRALEHSQARVLVPPHRLFRLESNSKSSAGLTAPPHALPDDALAYILFTSGSTGRPKGVMVEQRGVCNRLFWMQSRFPLGPEDVLLQKTPVTFDVSVWELFWWAWYGASLALLGQDEERDPEAMVAAIERHKVTVVHFVPSMLRVFLEHCRNRPEQVPRLSSLKYIFASGEALTPDCVALCNRLLYTTNGTELHNLYGPTEATVDVSWHPCSPPASHNSGEEGETEASRVPIGRPISNTAITVCDATGQNVPVGVTGELVLHGVQVARGYVNRPDLTAQVFSHDAATGQRSYRTGDLGRWTPQGVVEYLGRLDDQVKIRGFRIELGEVEAALEFCAGVAQAVVRMGVVGGMPALEAFILPVQGHIPSLPELHAALGKRLPAYMHPALYYQVESIPLGNNGKANRKALLGRPLGKSTEQGAMDQTNGGLAHASGHRLDHALAGTHQDDADIITDLRGMWHAVLPEAQYLDDDANFFTAGGNSLLLVRLLDMLQERWPSVFTLPDLFAMSSIATQAQRLRKALPADLSLPTSTQSSGMTSAAGAGPPQIPQAGPIAIIGMAVRLADYDSIDALWSDLVTGADRVSPLPPKRLHEQQTMLAAAGLAGLDATFKPAAYLDDISSFDPARFGMSPGDARRIDPEQRLFFSTALGALEDAGYGGHALDNAVVGVFAGASAATPFGQALRLALPEEAEHCYVLNVPSALVARLSYIHNWSGPAALVDTACSSVLVALHEACAALRRGDCALALVGGARIQPALLDNMTTFTIESGSGRTRTFDADADGTCAGEGAAVFLLKPLARALIDGDAIHALITGSAVNQDGRSAGIAAPNPAAQAAVITAAATAAGVMPKDLHFIEAHGTATTLGDPVEINGLHRAFAAAPPSRSLPVGSAKGHFGHLDVAAGALGLARAVLTLKRGMVPPQPHFTRPNPHIDFAAANLHVPVRPEPLPENAHPWRGGVSAFGLSGINAHIIVQEAPPQTPSPVVRDMQDNPWCCLVLSAASEDGLRHYVRRLLAALECPLDFTDVATSEAETRILRAVAGTLTVGRAHLRYRMAVAARDLPAARAELLRWLLAGGQSCSLNPEQIAHYTGNAVPVLHDTEAEAQAAMAAFIQGASPLWPEHLPVQRMHLPAAPLEPTPCWPDFATAAAAMQRNVRLWPGEAVASPQGWQHALPVHDPAFWPMAEHQLAGNPTLVGMAFPSLAAQAALRLQASPNDPWGGKAGGENCERAVVLEQIQWLRPLAAMPQLAATLTLRPLEQGFAVELAGGTTVPPVSEAKEEKGDSFWANYATAILRTIPTDTAGLHLRSRPEEGMTPLPIPAAHDSTAALVQVSPRWQCHTALWRSSDGRTTFARLDLPPACHGDLAWLGWHPALLDTAASLALDGRPLLPAACTRILLRHPLTPSLWARCVRRSPIRKNGGHEDRALVVDCTLHDMTGRELVALEGLSFLSPHPPKARLHTVVWTPLPRPTTEESVIAHDSGDARTLLLGQGPLVDAIADALAHPTRHAGRLPLRLPYTPSGMDELACAALAEVIHAEGVERILAVLPAALSADTALSPWDMAAPLRAVLQRMADLAPAQGRPLRWVFVGCAGVDTDTQPVQVVPEHGLALGTALAVRQEDSRLAVAFVDWQAGFLASPQSPMAPAVQTLTHHLWQAVDTHPWLLLDEAGIIHTPRLSAPLAHIAQSSGTLADTPIPVSPPPLAENACIVITGGLGGMGLALAEQCVPHLTPQLGHCLALLHRGAFPAETAWDQAKHDKGTRQRISTLRALKQRGINVTLYACDVSDRASLTATLNRIRRECGPITTVIHAAGVPGTGVLLHKTRQNFEAVIAPKLHGAYLLHELTLRDPVRYFVLASSRTALTGAPGQSDYCAANAALDSFARWRRAQGLPALALAWNTLAQTGMAARAGLHEPFMLHPSRLGDALLDALNSQAVHVALSLPGETLPGHEHTPDIPIADALAASPLPVVAAGLEGVSLRQAVLVIMERVLGYEGKLSLDDDFYALGGDSLAGLRIVAALNALRGKQVGLADLLAHSRLGDFVAQMEALHGAHPDTSPSDALTAAGAASPSPVAPPMERYPVSREQLAVLRAVTLSGPHTGYNLPQFMRLPTPCTEAALTVALARLSARHEVLRTRFTDVGQPVPHMLVLEGAPIQVESRSFPTLDEAARELVRPFDLETAPLCRVALLHVTTLPQQDDHGEAAGGQVLFFDIHHALADAQGVGLLLRDLCALLVGEHLPPPPLQQKDAAWRQQQIAATEEESARAYWLARYADGLPHTELAGDSVRPQWHTHRGRHARFVLPSAEVAHLRRIAAQLGVTQGSLLFGLWGLLVRANLTNATAQDVVMALAADTRDSGFESTAGMFACLLPVRLRMEGGESLADAIRAAHKANIEALRYRAFPLGSLLAALKPPVDSSRTLLAEVTFSYMNISVEAQPYSASHEASHSDFGKNGELYSVPHGGCKADLAVFISHTPEGLVVALEYYADRFAPERIEALGQRFVKLACSLLTEGTERSVRELLPLLRVEGPDTQHPTRQSHEQPCVQAGETTHENASCEQDITALALRMAHIWQRFFDLPSISPEDNFHDLGGHSLLAMQIVNALNETLALRLTLRDFLTHPEPRLLAAQLAASTVSASGHNARLDEDTPPELAAKETPDGFYPLSHAQQRLYIVQHMHENDTSYNVVFVFRLSRPLDAGRLRCALHTLARRQDILRTSIVEKDGLPLQYVSDDAMPLCESHSHPLPWQKACATVVSEALAPFAMTGPMARLVLCPTDDGGQCAALGMHHLLGDGWSLQILFDELMALYANKEAVLPPLPVQYRHFAWWQRQRRWEEPTAYWSRVLRHLPPSLHLPVDAPRAPHTHGPKANNDSDHGPVGMVTRLLDPATVAALRTFATVRRISLAACILALFAALLSRLCRQEDMLIGMGVAGRERTELEHLVGFFVNILPIRVRMPESGLLDELVNTVNESCLEALSRQDYPFDLLVRHCAPQNAVQRQMVNVMFEYQRYRDVAGLNSPTTLEVLREESLTENVEVVDATQWMPLARAATPPARYDLTLYAQDEPQGLLLRAEYDSTRYTEQAAAQWLSMLETLMTQAVTHTQGRSAKESAHED